MCDAVGHQAVLTVAIIIAVLLTSTASFTMCSRDIRKCSLRKKKACSATSVQMLRSPGHDDVVTKN
eukprot:1137961-Pelagomonas_calceolata.AAC.1